MLRLSALLLCAAVLVLPLPSQAQKAAPKQASAVPTEPNALAAWCNQAVFRKYGERAREHGPGTRMVKMPLEQHAAMQDSCIRSKGRIY